jgi:hypothetical protein
MAYLNAEWLIPHWRHHGSKAIKLSFGLKNLA